MNILETLLIFISRFGGGVNQIGSEIVRLSIGTAFWSILFLFAINVKKNRIDKIMYENFIIIGSALGVILQVLQLAIILYYEGNFSNVLNILERENFIFPPMIHFLNFLSISLISLYFLLFFKIESEINVKKCAFGTIYLALLYLVIGYGLCSILHLFKFCGINLLFHLSGIFITSIAIYKLDKVKNIMRINALSIILMLWLSEILNSIDIITQLQYSTLISPIDNNLQNFMIPVIIYFFIKVQTSELEEQKNEFILRSSDRQIIIQGVAHELRSPLAGLIGLIDVFKQKIDILQNLPTKQSCLSCKKSKFLDGFVLSGLNEIEEIVTRLNEMVINLTEFGKTSKKNELRCYNLTPLVETAVRYAKFTERSKLVTTHGIKTALKKECKSYSIISPSKFLQVIQNLIMNSIRAIQVKDDKSDPQIIVSLHTDKKNSVHIITIEDNGIGMTEDQLMRCTEKYYTTNYNTENSGLGLYFVSKYIKEFGGVLDIKSKRGVGTIIRILLPIVIVNPDEILCE